jgi:hypothetical protein
VQQSKKVLFAVVTILAMMGSASGAQLDWVLPIKKYTPGAINPAVTQSNIQSTICKSGWTSTVRPSTSYTNKLKTDQLATTYKSFAKKWGTDLSAYEEDHLISLQLGGNPTDPKNLFPQPYAGLNARTKDVIETRLKVLICSGEISLKDAQKAIATNWVLAYNKYK